MSQKQKYRMTELELKTLAREEQKPEENTKDDEFYEKYGLRKSKNYVDKEAFYNLMVEYSKNRDKVFTEEFKPMFDKAVEEAKAKGEPIPNLKDKVWKDKWMETKPQIPDSIGRNFLLIAEHLATLSNFSGYSYRNDFVSSAVESMVRYIDNFDVTKSRNPFAYFTQVAYYRFLAVLSENKKQSAIKGRLMMQSVSDEFVEMNDDSEFAVSNDAIRNAHTFVEIAYQMQQKEDAEKAEKKRIKEEKKKQKLNETNLSSLFIDEEEPNE